MVIFDSLIIFNLIKFIGSPSPGKSRPSLPTSPAHMAAMRAAAQQRLPPVPPLPSTASSAHVYPHSLSGNYFLLILD